MEVSRQSPCQVLAGLGARYGLVWLAGSQNHKLGGTFARNKNTRMIQNDLQCFFFKLDESV